MAHDIDFSTGRPAMAYVGEAPWHRLGRELPPGKPIEDWVEAAGLDWEIRQVPVQYLVEGGLLTMSDRFVLARSDTGNALSVVSEDYQIVQPREVLEFYRDLVDAYSYTLETAGALNGGRKFWALARTGRVDALDADGGTTDDLAAYLLLATSCDKTLATTATFTSIRVVCQNTLGFAMDDVATNKRRNIKIPHTDRFDSSDVKAELGLLDKSWEAFLKRVRQMASSQMKEREAGEFFERVLQQKEGKPLSTRAQNEHNALRGLFASAPGQELSTAKDTLWGAVNAVTYYVDHVRSARGAGDQVRLDSAWFGSGNRMKERAWALATDLNSTASVKGR